MRELAVITLLCTICCSANTSSDRETSEQRSIPETPAASSSRVPVPAELSRETPDWPPFLVFEGEFVWGGLPKTRTQILALDSYDVWFVLSARVLNVISGDLPEDWSAEVNFGVHSPAFYFLSQGIRVQDGVYVPEGRFLFYLWRSVDPPWVLEIRDIGESHGALVPPNKALQLTPESHSATTCGIVLAAGPAVPALPVSAFWCS